MEKIFVGSNVNILKRSKQFSISKSHHRIDRYGGGMKIDQFEHNQNMRNINIAYSERLANCGFRCIYG